MFSKITRKMELLEAIMEHIKEDSQKAIDNVGYEPNLTLPEWEFYLEEMNENDDSLYMTTDEIKYLARFMKTFTFGEHAQS